MNGIEQTISDIEDKLEYAERYGIGPTVEVQVSRLYKWRNGLKSTETEGSQ